MGVRARSMPQKPMQERRRPRKASKKRRPHPSATAGFPNGGEFYRMGLAITPPIMARPHSVFCCRSVPGCRRTRNKAGSPVVTERGGNYSAPFLLPLQFRRVLTIPHRLHCLLCSAVATFMGIGATRALSSLPAITTIAAAIAGAP